MTNIKVSKPKLSTRETENKSEAHQTHHLENIRQALRICALLHDVGHPPYSHTCEQLLHESGDFLDIMAKEIEDDEWKKWPHKTPNDIKRKNDFRQDCEILKTIYDLHGADASILGEHETYTKFLVLSKRHGIRPVIEKWARNAWDIHNTRDINYTAYRVNSA